MSNVLQVEPEGFGQTQLVMFKSGLASSARGGVSHRTSVAAIMSEESIRAFGRAPADLRNPQVGELAGVVLHQFTFFGLPGALARSQPPSPMTAPTSGLVMLYMGKALIFSARSVAGALLLGGTDMHFPMRAHLENLEFVWEPRPDDEHLDELLREEVRTPKSLGLLLTPYKRTK